MSDQFYAVQFRSMHTGIHNIAVYTIELAAQGFFDELDSNEQFPEDFEFDGDYFVGFQEIDHRNKPYEAFDMEILYINEWGLNGNHIPDVYNY